MAVITTIDLSLDRDGKRVLSDVAFLAQQGEITGILGSKGSGKSSLLHVLAGLVSPSSGSAVVNDFDILKSSPAVRGCVGMVFQELFFDDFLTARDVLDLHGQLHGMSTKLRKHRIESLLSSLGLAERGNVQVRYFTLFKKRKLALARAVMHSPAVLLLDELTAGLTGEQCADMWSTIIKVNAQFKISVVVASSSWEECERLCDRVVVLHRGMVLCQGTPESLKEEVGGSTVVLHLDRSQPRLIEALRSLWFVKDAKGYDKVVEVIVRPKDLEIDKITKLVNRFPCRILGLTMHKPTLNDVFYKYSGCFMEEAGGTP